MVAADTHLSSVSTAVGRCKHNKYKKIAQRTKKVQESPGPPELPRGPGGLPHVPRTPTPPALVRGWDPERRKPRTPSLRRMPGPVPGPNWWRRRLGRARAKADGSRLPARSPQAVGVAASWVAVGLLLCWGLCGPLCIGKWSKKPNLTGSFKPSDRGTAASAARNLLRT